jgi:catechol 2,3-dioxygenase-like lactoylglutathione lyase family enzyme
MKTSPSTAAPAARAGEIPWDPVGWREAILIVPALEPWIEVLSNVGGWEMVQRTAPDTGLNGLWSLPKGATTEQVLMRSPGVPGGMIRLGVVRGAPQRRIRPHDQPWETGGTASLYVRVRDMAATRAALEARGWNAANEPVRYRIRESGNIGPYRWVPRSPDGIRLELFQVSADQKNAWDAATSASIPLKDPEASRALLKGVMHLNRGGHVEDIGENGPNKLGLPWSLQRTAKVDIYGLGVAVAAGGSFDILSMPDAQGRDYSDGARPPNLGIAGFRFVVPDVALMARLFKAAGHPPVAPVQQIDLSPYGRTKAFAVSVPDGVWFEFVQGKVG